MENRGKNSAFIINGVKMILSKNYDITINDEQEIDTFLSVGENLEILKNKYQMKISISELERW